MHLHYLEYRFLLLKLVCAGWSLWTSAAKQLLGHGLRLRDRTNPAQMTAVSAASRTVKWTAMLRASTTLGTAEACSTSTGPRSRPARSCSSTLRSAAPTTGSPSQIRLNSSHTGRMALRDWCPSRAMRSTLRAGMPWLGIPSTRCPAPPCQARRLHGSSAPALSRSTASASGPSMGWSRTRAVSPRSGPAHRPPPPGPTRWWRDESARPARAWKGP
mmetsp:Transcript_9950/g.23756  ORF Transcript_9950/g.23756 Transcript_9950/m.23756 type:complete len:216 (-) Transcript_9950:625-1272(-)